MTVLSRLALVVSGPGLELVRVPVFGPVWLVVVQDRSASAGVYMCLSSSLLSWRVGYF